MWELRSRETLRRLSADYLNYDDVGAVMLEVDLEMTGGRYQHDIISNLRGGKSAWSGSGLAGAARRVQSRILGADGDPGGPGRPASNVLPRTLGGGPQLSHGAAVGRGGMPQIELEVATSLEFG